MKQLFLILAATFFAAMLQAAIRVDVRPDRDVAYVGEAFILTVYIDGHGDPTEPDLSAIARRADIAKVGERSHNSHTTMIINGRRTIQQKFGYEYQYQVTPKQAGRIPTGPVIATIGGTVYRGSGSPVTVMGIEKQDTVLIEMSSSSTNAVIYEPFTVTLDILVRQLSGEFSDTVPLFAEAAPRIEAAYLNGLNEEGLESKNPARVLQRYMVNRNQMGFRINNHNEPLTNLLGFNLSSRQYAHFQLPMKSVTRNGKPYLKYQITLAYMSTRPNSLSFGPVSIKGAFAEMRGATPQRRSIFTRYDGITVEVDYPPGPSRPDSFIGAVSTNLLAEAQLDLTTCQVGDPIQLTLNVTGVMNPGVIVNPRLAGNKEISKAYALYEDSVSSTTIKSGKSFTYTLRPKIAGTFEFPAIEVGYYDPSISGYRTSLTRPIPLRVNEAHGITIEHVIGVRTNKVGNHSLDRSEAAGIRLSESGTMNQAVVEIPRFLIAALGGPALFCLVCIIQLTGRGLRKSGEKGSRRKGLGQALSRLKTSPEGPNRVSESIIIRDYLGTCLAKDAAGLTPGGMAAFVPELDAHLLQELEGLYTECFNAEFSPAGIQTPPIDREAIRDLLKKVDREIGK